MIIIMISEMKYVLSSLEAVYCNEQCEVHCFSRVCHRC
jgi:hypothetical protein